MTEFEEGEPVIVISKDYEIRKYHGKVGIVVSDMNEELPYEYAVRFSEEEDDFNYFNADELENFCQTHECKPMYSTKKGEYFCPFCK